ncbi:hypothetical protein M3Y95_01132000 [Aphelenchoides besseyi]|nr:hypothetical protein M3Y95_01132000 [Aphelenchoides besseyi]
MKLPAYILLEYLFIIICFLFAGILQSHLLYRISTLQLYHNLSISLRVNIFCWILVCCFGIIHLSYIFVGSSGSELFNGTMLFWSGDIYVMCSLYMTSSLSFLLINRILVLINPLSLIRESKMFGVINILVCFFVGSICGIIVFIAEQPVPTVTGKSLEWRYPTSFIQ